MNKLSNEDILFINSYLKNSDIVFTDIRLEMIDHVASEIETKMYEGDTRGFYYIFKDYMVKNKTNLLKDSRVYYKASDKKILKAVLKKTFSFLGLILFFSIFFSFNLFNDFIENQNILTFINSALFGTMIIVGFIYYVFIKKKKERYSSVERIAFYFMIVVQLINILMNSNLNIETLSILDIIGLKTATSFFISSLIVLLLIAFQLKKEYQLKYKSVA